MTARDAVGRSDLRYIRPRQNEIHEDDLPDADTVFELNDLALTFARRLRFADFHSRDNSRANVENV